MNSKQYNQISKAVEIQFKLKFSIFPADLELFMGVSIGENLIIIFVVLVLLHAQQQNKQQISTCLGNCLFCNETAPDVCLSQNLQKTNTPICVPFYRGQNCNEQAFAYENVLRQSKTFDGWNQFKTSSCLLVQKNSKNQLTSNQNFTYVGIGPFSSSQNLYKVISLNSSSQVSRIILKFTTTIDDPLIQSYFSRSNTSSSSASNTSSSTSTQTITQTLPDGTQVITIIETRKTNTTNQQAFSSSISKGHKFMYVELIDSGNTSSIIQRKLVSYNVLSKIRTSCGYVYTFQVSFNLLKQYSQVGVKLYLYTDTANDQKAVSWSVINFQVNAGCRGYVVTSNQIGSYNCDACLSGFYPVNSPVNGEVQECRFCDYRCKTCISATSCLTCIENTIFNQNTGMCEFSQYFTKSNSSQILRGGPVNTGSLFASQVVKSSGGNIQIQENLQNYQDFTVMFDILYSAAFRNSGDTVKVMINGQQFAFKSNTLPLDVATIIPGISSLTSNIYRSKLSYNIKGLSESNFTSVSVNSSAANSSASFSNASPTANILIVSSNLAAGVSSGEQIGITNVNTVQFQCSKNCLQCTYSQFTQISKCNKCHFFFDLDSNCLNCANGFFKIEAQKVQQCIKCHSTCKQCSGPQVQDCLTCFDGFKLGQIIYNYTCINCIYEAYSNPSGNSKSWQSCNQNQYCLKNSPLNQVLTNKQCELCLKSNKDSSPQAINVCNNCWLKQNLAKSNCQPIPERGYQFYGSDVSQGVISNQWTSNKNLVKLSLNSFYRDLYGVNHQKTSANQTTILTFTEPLLPSHRGLTIFFNIFKINTWNAASATIGSTSAISNDTINILIRSQKSIIRNETIFVNNQHGNNIYGAFGSGNEMIYTFLGNYQEHTSTSKMQIAITATHTGVFVRNLEVYLGNCADCKNTAMNYEVYYIPMYSTNSTQTGLDVWLTFNQGVNFAGQDQQAQDLIINSFQFSIDQLGYKNLLSPKIRQNKLSKWNYVKYFIPINGSLCNATLRINNSMAYNIYSKVSKSNAYLTSPLSYQNHRNLKENHDQSLFSEYQFILSQDTYLHTRRLLLNERLSSTNVEQKIQRYQDLALDQRKSMQQLDSFYQFFQWFTLFTMIVFAFFGLGLIFQQFSILIQLLFLHIYTSTNILPASFKQPLSQMQKMQNLNFFAYTHAQDIQHSWFGDIEQNSPYPLTQYNVDVYFARSFYAIIIINLIYLFWFLVLLIFLKFVRPFRNSSNRVVRFFRDIPKRPLNYFDQIWRYQFITTMWASFIQFHNFDGPSPTMRLNLALCIASFVISLIWPVFVMVYTYRQHHITNVQTFLYLYNDIFYRKISSIADKKKYYLYIGVRFGRYFFYALFIAVFVYQSVIGPALLLAFTLLEMIYIVNFKIFRDKVYLTFKLIENAGFIILEILLLIVYGFSDNTVSKEGYASLGYGLDALHVLMIINGIVRFIYLGYKKIRQLIQGRYDIGDTGDLQNFDNRKVINIELPATERGLI